MDINSLLKPFQHFGVHLGLSRIIKLLANLGNPHHQVPIIHVTGTNGKGSVCAYLHSVLAEAGYRTGCYTSPHLVDWTERICINKQPISSGEFSQLIQQVQEAIHPEDECPTQFEVITAAAWLYFAQAQVDIAVIEVGLGGRLDATNVCNQPLVTVITSISREHWQQLGPTVADIAREKAGIIKHRCPLVVGQLPAEAEKVVRWRAEELESLYIQPQPAREIAAGWAEYISWENSKIIKYPLALPGQIQLINSALALAALEILQNLGWVISLEAIVNGMGKTQWAGRMQWVTWKNQKLLIDGAHNPGAAHALRDYLDSLAPGKITWIVGMLTTKEHTEIFSALLRSQDQLYLVPVPDHSSAAPIELAKIAKEICPDLSICQTYPDLVSALNVACTSTNNQVVLCGSLYLIGHFLSIAPL
ncbi:bifunctional folylpolyglutamate synthase/dihydrofolate synthase [Umezakia ovalisporum]|uniref:tetrahydrofolate synthase n=2 Tax=Umezakia ovalisporum TaxID=75695 RepID=A0AA43KGJ0_9CYAN|nr:folylpolyglutamate synthase/dihydrofolate synthase family protein [Umezakia ovalisporum]MBI1241923.1 bifunctional folylpolyglutamate synthase/dihydrofolate synthase [Nostoc sp. RI_552]MDH6058536.1 bifunctional folylpolyglutamate synthase/dihydrofolate synthase [Umezakia ovalisporum FSS-43]MDH6064978.1 bifunctional folylpolyglutamate synthase/dihydrofolate synthase [Umezakia ovalisporum FSS-62]MDH6067609.1 bifunctional folylpolyglutamate synthase/dihydrofolate synthase [Umezakia ovalisporum A